MKQVKTHRTMTAICAALPVVLLAGCFELDVETTLSPDGSGERRMELLLSVDDQDEEETGLSIEDFQAIYGFTEKNGWKITNTTLTIVMEKELILIILKMLFNHHLFNMTNIVAMMN